MERLGEAVEACNVRLYLFCLMSNHFHLVLETPEGNLSRFMQKLSTAYTVYYNRRHRRHGHLFDGRFKAKLVEGDEYLLKLSRYVHLNPVQVGSWKKRSVAERIEHLRYYRWSSYRDYILEAREFRFLEKSPVLAEMGGRVKDRPACYREFVETGLAEDDLEFQEAMTASPLGIGDSAFRQWAWVLHRDRAAMREHSEDLAFRKTGMGLQSEKVLECVARGLGENVAAFRERRRNSPLRAIAVRFLGKYAGMRQREIATALGMGTGTAVSAQARRLEGLLAADPKLRKLVEKIERSLEKIKADTNRAK